jgi:hypothetical protein
MEVWKYGSVKVWIGSSVICHLSTKETGNAQNLLHHCVQEFHP